MTPKLHSTTHSLRSPGLEDWPTCLSPWTAL